MYWLPPSFRTEVLNWEATFVVARYPLGSIAVPPVVPASEFLEALAGSEYLVLLAFGLSVSLRKAHLSPSRETCVSASAIKWVSVCSRYAKAYSDKLVMLAKNMEKPLNLLPAPLFRPDLGFEKV